MMEFTNWRPDPDAVAHHLPRNHGDTEALYDEPVVVPGFTGLVEDLFEAVSGDDKTERLCRVLAEPHTDPNGLLSQQTALHVAAECRNVNCIRVLLAAGASVAVKDEKGFTPLHRAVGTDEPEVTQLIARAKHAGASPAIICSSIEHAAQKGCVHALLELFAELSCRQAGECHSLLPGLLGAARNGQIKALECILSYQVFTEKQLSTALAVGVLSGCCRAATILVKARANPEVTDRDGWTPLSHVAAKGDEDMCHTLIALRASVAGTRHSSPLEQAVRYGHASIVKLLLSHGAQDDCTSPDRCNLVLAAAAGQVDCVQHLLEFAGASADPKRAALLAAVTNGEVEVVNELVSQDADGTVTRCDGWNTAHIAASNGNNLMAMLEEAGLQDPFDGRTADASKLQPLHIAAAAGHVGLVLVLLEQVEVDSRDANGKTALMHAVEATPVCKDVVVALLKAGANVDAQDKRGNSPLSASLKAYDKDPIGAELMVEWKHRSGYKHFCVADFSP